MKPKVNILICEPSDIIIEGLKALILPSQRFYVQDTLHSASYLSERITMLQPDIIIVNPTIVEEMPLLRPNQQMVALVYQYMDEEKLQRFRNRLDIRASSGNMMALLESCVAADADEAETMENYEISDREREVLVLIAKGYSSKEIADQLNISIHTVNSHRKNITHKTGIKSVAGLAVYAMLHNLT